MSQLKDIKIIKELQGFFSRDQKLLEVIINFYQNFKICKTAQEFNRVKKKGFQPVQVLLMLLMFPFLKIANVYSLYQSGIALLKEVEKDVYYRLKNNPNEDWRKVLLSFAKRFIKYIEKNTEPENNKGAKKQVRCFIIDDTTIRKKGKKIELIGRVFDHITKRYVLGFKQLILTYWDGKSLIPIDFSFHAEQGKNKNRPFGLKKKELKERYSKKRSTDSAGYKRTQELLIDKISNAIALIKRAVQNGIIVDYVLMDKWFISELIIKEIRKIKKGIMHIVAACKMDKRKYDYEGRKYTAKELLKKLKSRRKRSRRPRGFYIEAEVIYKGIPLKLFFNKFLGQKHWSLLITTDMKLKFNELIRIYTIRWTIEVFIKESKQNLYLGKSQAQDFDSQIADTTISMINYIILSLCKRFKSYETIGSLFRELQRDMLELTIAERLWQLFIQLQNELAEIFNIDVSELIKKLIYSSKTETKVIKIFRFLIEDEKVEILDKAA